MVIAVFKIYKVIELYTWKRLGVRPRVEDEGLGGYMHSLPTYESSCNQSASLKERCKFTVMVGLHIFR